jgi:hypothetical protein
LKLYGKRFIRNSMNRVSSTKQETRDGILWDVDSASKICHVKIQGSNTLIAAYYPENWEQAPNWLKPGNAVKIMHTGGVRGRIEVIGHGQLVPTPVSGNQFPTVETAEGSIISGCGLLAAATPRMVVLVRTGTYRISGVLYGMPYITMDDGVNYLFGDGGPIDGVAAAVAISAAPSAGNYRQDMLSVGTNGVVDYTAGTPAISDPVKPTPAADHLLLGYVFVPAGTTEITYGENIGKEYQIAVPSSLEVTIEDDDLAWSDLSTTLTVEVLDQYGNHINGTGIGWSLRLDIQAGNGTISSAESGDSLTSVRGHTGTGYSYVFTYTRDNLDPGDVGPSLWIELENENSFGIGEYITLRTATGEVMV